MDMRFKEVEMKKLCEVKDCPYCKAGIPRKVMVPIWDELNRIFTYHIMSDEQYKKMYGKEVNNAD